MSDGDWAERKKMDMRIREYSEQLIISNSNWWVIFFGIASDCLSYHDHDIKWFCNPEQQLSFAKKKKKRRLMIIMLNVEETIL